MNLIANNIIYGLMMILFCTILLTSVKILRIRIKRPFIFSGVFVTDYLVFTGIIWGMNLIFGILEAKNLYITTSLSLSFIIMQAFADINLVLLALRTVNIPKTSFRIFNLIIFTLGHFACVFIPIFLPCKTEMFSMPVSQAINLEEKVSMSIIHILFSLNVLNEQYSFFNTVVLLTYFTFYIILYIIMIVYVKNTKPDIRLGLFYNITQVITLNVMIKCFGMIPLTYSSEVLMMVLWLLYVIITLNCCKALYLYTKKGYLFFTR